MLQVRVFGKYDDSFYHFESDSDAIEWLVKATDGQVLEVMVSHVV
jgi:hypothetical protein